MVRRKELDEGLDQLKQKLLEMGGIVETVLGEAIQTLQALDVGKAKRIIAGDADLNRLEESIEEVGSRMIATQQPVAKDLRRILTAFKMASDLERMGDLAVDIAKVTVRLEGQTLIKPLVDLPRMAEIARLMIYESIQSYVQENVDLAYKMSRSDDEVDELYSQVIRDLTALMIENPKIITQAGLISFVGRYVERIADYATNIGESVVYLVTGKRPDLNA